jgi:hypothetical protein
MRSPLYDVMDTLAVAQDPFSTSPFNVAAFTYDCVIAFAIAFSNADDVNDGAEVARRFRDTRFSGATDEVYFDLQGDRDPSTVNCTSLRIVPVVATPREIGGATHRACLIRATQMCFTIGYAPRAIVAPTATVSLQLSLPPFRVTRRLR